MSAIDDIQKIDVKVFATKGEDIDPYEFVPVLQRWIQEHTVPGTLIDVADYSHMHQGPGVILVGHQYNVSVDYAEGKMGVLFHYKRPAESTFAERAKSAVKQALNAATLLEEDAAFKGRLAFDTNTVQLIVNDRSIDVSAAKEAVNGALPEAEFTETGDARNRASFRLPAKV